MSRESIPLSYVIAPSKSPAAAAHAPSKARSFVHHAKLISLLTLLSRILGVLRESLAGQVVTLTEDRLPEAEELAGKLASFVRDPQYSADDVRWDAFDAYSARNSARVLANAIDRALEMFEKRRASGTA